jgi:hypothetical protein
LDSSLVGQDVILRSGYSLTHFADWPEAAEQSGAGAFACQRALQQPPAKSVLRLS